MKRGFFKSLALLLVIFLVTIAFVPMAALNTEAAAPAYLTTGLEGLYLGNNNTGSGNSTTATTWADLSGKGNNITGIATDASNHFTTEALLLNSKQVDLPSNIVNVVNGQAFTVEIVFGDFNSLGTTWNTFMNSTTNDCFAWFRTLNGDTLNFKSVPGTGTQNARPSATDALNLLNNSTVTITYKVGGKITMYVDGVQVGEKTDAGAVLAAADLFIGHAATTKNFEAEYIGMRFYSAELTAAQVASNYQQDLILLAGDTEESEESEESEASSVSDSTIPIENSGNNASNTMDSSSTTSTDVVETGDNDVIILDMIAIIASIAFGLYILKKRTVRA